MRSILAHAPDQQLIPYNQPWTKFQLIQYNVILSDFFAAVLAILRVKSFNTIK